ncbi:MAG: TolC family protein [Planctomycetes bacterium]|nr:TolC family protein [Planctomycetota bacterium]
MPVGEPPAHPVGEPGAEEPPQGPLTLQRCLDLALGNNPDIAGGRASVDAALAQQQVSEAERWPTLSAVGGYTHHMRAERLVPASRPNQAAAYGKDLFRGDLVLEVPLFTGGRIQSTISASELLREAAGHRLVRTWQELEFNITSVFCSILRQRHVVESVNFSQKALQEHRKRIEGLLAAQKAAKVDLLRTEVRLADLAEKLVGEKNRLDILHRVLANLVGLSDSSSNISIQGELAQPEGKPGITAMLATAYANRADLLAAQAETKAQACDLAATGAGLWPALYFSGSYGARALAHASDKTSGGNEYEDVGRVGLLLDIPLFEAGRTKAALRRERAELVAAQQKVRKLKLQIRLDVETAVLNRGSSLERVQATQAAIEQARESLRIEREKFELGKGTTTDVLDAQSALVDAQTSYYRALADSNTAQAQLRLAAGQ